LNFAGVKMVMSDSKLTSLRHRERKMYLVVVLQTYISVCV